MEENYQITRHSSMAVAQNAWIPPSSQHSMKALRIVEKPCPHDELRVQLSKCLTLVDLPVPKPTTGFLLVRIRAAAINPSDAANALGYFPHTTYPRIPGRDWAGIVMEANHPLCDKEVFGTSGRQIGFTLDGPSSEYCLVPEGGIVAMPQDLSFSQAATVGVPWTTAYLMLERAVVTADDIILVLGSSGAVGSAACQLSRARGCKVITAARTSTADINISNGSMVREEVEALTGHGGPSVVLDTVGDPKLMASALDLLRVGGRLAYISAPKSYQAQFSFDMRKLYRTEKSIIGCNSLQHSTEYMCKILQELAPGFRRHGPFKPIEASEIKEIGFEDALEAYRRLWERDVNCTRVHAQFERRVVIKMN
jgi:NADPH:quinone reductase-like Zn-dependent oxidoreductase